MMTALERGVENRCCSLESLDDARCVAHMLDIPFYLLMMLYKHFKHTVVDCLLRRIRCRAYAESVLRTVTAISASPFC